MTFLKNGLIVTSAAVALSGCSLFQLIELATNGAEVAAVAVAAQEDAQELMDLADTNDSLTATTTPLSGTAVYSGQGGVQGVSGSDRYTIGGAMTVNADFDGGTVTGAISGLKASDLSDAEYEELQDLQGVSSLAGLRRAYELAERIQEVDGEFTFSGTVTGAAVEMDASGSVEYESSTFEVSGKVDGDVKGTSGEAMSLDEGTGFSLTRDGTALTSAGMQGELARE